MVKLFQIVSAAVILASIVSAHNGGENARAAPSLSTAHPLLIAPVLPERRDIKSRQRIEGDWAKARCGGDTFPATGVASWQWTPALDGAGYDYADDGWVVSGTVVAPSMSDSDNPLAHPFGNDFDWYVAPDPPYDYLLARGNASNKLDFDRITRRARAQGLNVPHGVLGAEIDSGLLPAAYRVRENDRIVMAGRWIVDCAHDDFHTEIHPPLLIVAARPLSSNSGVLLTVTSRPWLVGQSYPEGNFVDHLRREFERLPDIPFTRYCCSRQIEVHDPILSPFASSRGYDFWLALPTVKKQSARIRYHFATRRSVAMRLYRTKQAFLGIHITLDAAGFASAAPPPKHEVIYTPEALEKLDKNGRAKAGFEEARRRLGLMFWAKAALNRGIKADQYDPIVAPFEPCDSGASVLPLRALDERGLEIPLAWSRDEQPFPVIGWLEIDRSPGGKCQPF